MALSSDKEARLNIVTLTLCDLCLDGAGGECHVPGCALWMSQAPDIPIREHAASIVAAPAGSVGLPSEGDEA
jgi:hypothetical protein